ncbi:MAG: recombination protein NinG [Rikenellaceae bacterium]
MKGDKELDRVFSIFIRRRDEGKGCISCGQRLRFDYCDAGHFIPRVHIATRWNEDNVHGQCYQCNRMQDGNEKKYRESLIRRIGIERVEELERLKHPTLKLSASDIEQLTEKYKQLIKSKL